MQRITSNTNNESNQQHDETTQRRNLKKQHKGTMQRSNPREQHNANTHMRENELLIMIHND